MNDIMNISGIDVLRKTGLLTSSWKQLQEVWDLQPLPQVVMRLSDGILYTNILNLLALQLPATVQTIGNLVQISFPKTSFTALR